MRGAIIAIRSSRFTVLHRWGVFEWRMMKMMKIICGKCGSYRTTEECKMCLVLEGE